MPIYEFSRDTIISLHKTTFDQVQVQERRDLQRLLRANVEVIAPDTLVIAEEFGEWDESRRRIDLLGVDRDANLVVIELKRTEDGGHMELQAIRYAAMVSTMTFDQAADVFDRYLMRQGRGGADARSELLEFLGWDEPDHDQFAQDVKIVLASAEFSRELTTSVLWLIGRDIDVRCVRLQPYELDGKILVDVQQIIPLPEAAEYQVQLREKARKERQARANGADYTRFNLSLADQTYFAESKRRVIYLTCKFLCDRGVHPDDISNRCGKHPNGVWYSVEGEVSLEEFLRLAEQKSASGGRKFVPRRFFCAEGELVRMAGCTYALSNQWGGDRWLQAMTAIRDAYSDQKIQFSAVE